MSKPKRSHPESRRSSVSEALLLSVRTPNDDASFAERSLAELELLLHGLGITVRDRVVQRRDTRDAPAYVGEGKLRELALITGGPGEATRGPALPRPSSGRPVLVVVDDELTPGQQRHLERALGVEVLDRTAVILRVFESRARTREAKLEVELARLEYELPRVRDDASLGDREGGGGRAGRGHSNVELAKQRARDRIASVRRELEQVASTADRRREGRAGAFRVALVGYTNAGKSSVMRRLTGSDVYVEDKLFATLGTTARALLPPATPPIIAVDTVGFLHRLPHALMASFRSTLAEANEAWLLLHVVDASDPAFRMHLDVTGQALGEVGARSVPALLLLNKADRLEAHEREALQREFPEALVMSAFDAGDLGRLRARVDAFFAGFLVERTLTFPYALQGVFAEAREQLQVVTEDYGEAVTVTVRATPEVLDRLEAKLPSEGRRPDTKASGDEVRVRDLAARRGLSLSGPIAFNELGLDFQVAIARASDGARWVLRIPRHEHATRKVEHEVRTLAFLRASRLPFSVPDWRVVTPDLIAYPLLEDSPALVVPRGDAPPALKIDLGSDTYLRTFARALAALHSLPVEAAARAGLRTRTPQQARQTVADDIARVAREFDVNPGRMRRWRTWLDDDACWPDFCVPIHGDLYAGHVLVDGSGQVTGMIDWTEARVDDPAIDMSGHLQLFGEPALEKLLLDYAAEGARVWPGLARHVTERLFAAPVTLALFALDTGDAPCLTMAKEQLLTE
jgi:GTPase